MTTRTELLDMIANGENSSVEFKRDVIENHALAKELVAFSNFAGGAVLLGVEDNGAIIGIARPNIEEFVMFTCRDKIRPAIIPYFEVIRNVDAGRDVAFVRVERGYAVHSQWHNNRNTYFIRVGTQSREPTAEELGRLFQQRGTVRAELQPITGAALADLDRRRLRDYFNRIRQQDVPADTADEEWMQLLSNAEIMIENRPALGGLLLFGSNPNRFLPHAGLTATAFPGIDKDYAAQDRAQLRGAMTPLMDQQGTLLETGIVERALEFIQRNVAVSAVLDNGRRIERPAYPPEALREAIVNSLVHRDYLLAATDVELSIYANRVEIISPGRLPNGITPERMRTGCRASRNQLLKDVMGDYGYVEHLGMGIPRKIVRGMRQHNGTEPELVDDGEQFTVRLLRGP